MRGGCWLALTTFLAVGACSASAPPSTANQTFGEQPYSVVMSDSGALRIEVRVAPQAPPEVGVSAVQLRVTSNAAGATTSYGPGAPVDGLVMSMVPFMPAMGHGGSVDPAFSPQGNGRYRFDNVYLFMPGTWQLRT